jgi:PAS domain S-box-containing protein
MEKQHEPYRILIVEDNPGDVLLITDYLEEEIVKPQLTFTESFKDTQRLLLDHSADLDIILLDLTLPDLEGERLLTQVLKLSADIPIVVLTGYSNLSFAKKSLALGALDYLLKDELNATILYKSIIYSIERNDHLQQIKDSQKRYADLFQLSPIPMWVYDAETLQFLDVNEAAINHYGYAKSEFLQMTIRDIRPESELSRLNDALKMTQDEESYFFQGEFIHQKKGGEKIIVEVRSNIIYIEGKKAEVVLANDVTERHKMQEELHTNTYLVETTERKRIAAAIHDGFQQIILAALMRFQNVRSKLSILNDQVIAKRYQEALDLLNEGIAQARNMAHELVPIQVEVDGLSGAIRDLIAKYGSVGLRVDFEENLGAERFAVSLEVLLFRLVQEGLNNVVKHAEATQVRIKVCGSNSGIRLVLTDNGKGFELDKIPKGSFGLNSLQSRVKSATGDFKITSGLGKGTQWDVYLPRRI